MMNMGLKCSRVLFILGIVFAVCVNSDQSTYYCYYYSDSSGYWQICTISVGKIAGFVIAGVVGLLILLCKICICLKVCAPEKHERVAVRPTTPNIHTAEDIPATQQPVDDHDPTSQHEASGHANPSYNINF